MYWFKACPRCHGDLSLGEDSGGLYQSCVQCGFLRDIGSTYGTVERKSLEEKLDANAQSFHSAYAEVIELHDAGNKAAQIAETLKLNVHEVAGVIGQLTRIRKQHTV